MPRFVINSSVFRSTHFLPYTDSMRSAWLPLLLHIVGALLSVSGLILRLNHLISLCVAFAMLTAGVLAVGQARRLKRTPAPR
jgi:hypothetical protein